jgi:hypothetical protein
MKKKKKESMLAVEARSTEGLSRRSSVDPPRCTVIPQIIK